MSMSTTEAAIPLSLLSKLPMMACATDSSGRIRFVNDAWAKALGYRPEELVGRALAELVVESHRGVLESAIGGGEAAWSIEARWRCKDGQAKRLAVEASTSQEDGLMLVVARDVPEPEAAPGAPEELFRLLIESIPQQVCWKDERSVYRGCNENFARAAGLGSSAEIVGKRDEDIPWTETAYRAQGREITVVDGASPHAVATLTLATGAKAWLDIRTAKIRGERGTLEVVEDITRRWQSERELEKFFAVCPEPLCVFGMSGQLLRWNSALETTLGHSAEALGGMSFLDLVHPDDVDATEAQIKRIEATPMMLGLENRLRARTGLYVWLSWSLLSAPEEGLIYAAARNVGKRKRLERALMQRIELKMLAASISSHFVNARLEDLDRGLSNALAELGRLLGADRASLFVLSEDGAALLNTHEWCDEGVPSLREERAVVLRDQLDWLSDQSTESDDIHVGRVRDLGPGDASRAAALEAQGVKSFLRMPVRYAGRLVGAVGLDSVREHKNWDKDARAMLRVMGEMLALTLERKRAEIGLREIIDQQRTAIQTLSTPIIQVWDDVLALPLVGNVNSHRAAEITDKLLHAIVSTKSRYAILDLTGVDDVDTYTAQHLLGILRAIELLGAQGVVSGVRPPVALTMASLELNLAPVYMHRDLQEALKWCMRDAERARRPRARPAKKPR